MNYRNCACGSVRSRRSHLVASVSATILAIFDCSAAQAQSVAPPVAASLGQAEPGALPDNQDGEKPQGDIVVTGSRLNRAGFEAPTPVTMISTDTLSQKAPSSLPDALTQLPQFQAGISAAQERVTGIDRARGGNYLNLRALGPQRVLVLQDGHRIVPTGTNGGTDANLIPQMLVDRIDVVTGGASAAYGSDAVSGVVNFVINDRLRGVKLLGQGGISGEGDNQNYRVGAAFGAGFADDRLHLIGSVEHFRSYGIERRSDREIGRRLLTVTGAGTSASPLRYVENTRYTTAAFGGYINTGPLAGRQFLPSGATGPFVPGVGTGRAGLGVGGDGAFLDPSCCTLIGNTSTYQTFGRMSYDLSPAAKIYVQGGYNYARNFDTPVPNFRLGGGVTVFRDNAFLNQNLSATDLAALGSTPSFTISRVFTEWGIGQVFQRSRSIDGRIGIEGGTSGGRLKYDVSYSIARSNLLSSATEADSQRFYAAGDAVRNSQGNIVCRITISNPGLQDQCVPLNSMGVGSASRAAIDYVMRASRSTTINTLEVIDANISGEPFDTWAGPVSLAFGGEYRWQSLSQVSNSNPAVPVDFTGIRGVPSGTGQFFINNVGTARGRYTVKELYAEAAVPLLKDSGFGKSFDVNVAGRLTDYSTSGRVTTWKVGATYEPIDAIKLRGTISRDIRAPTLFELFSGQTFSLTTLSDPLTNVLSTVPIVSGGNADLKPEVAKTYTAGLVLRPGFARGLNASIDFYDISIADAIASPFQFNQVVDLCAASGYTSFICANIERPLGPTNTSAANFPTRVFLNVINVSTIKTRGLDIELSYRGTAGPGSFSVRALGTRLLSYSVTPFTGSTRIEYAGTADFPDTSRNAYPLPKVRANLELSYKVGGLGLYLQERLLGSFRRSDLQVYEDKKVSAIVYTDASLTYDFGENGGRSSQVFFTVNNVMNTQPPIFTVSNTPGLALPTLRSAYDIVGRQFTLGLKLKI